MHIKEINQKTVDDIKKGLEGFMTENLKLVGIKFQFRSEDGVLCEQGMKADGFDEDEWNE